MKRFFLFMFPILLFACNNNTEKMTEETLIAKKISIFCEKNGLIDDDYGVGYYKIVEVNESIDDLYSIKEEPSNLIFYTMGLYTPNNYKTQVILNGINKEKRMHIYLNEKYDVFLAYKAPDYWD